MTRQLAGECLSIVDGVARIRLWADPDTGEVVEVDVPLLPSVAIGGTVYASVGDDGGIALGSPFASPGVGAWSYAGTNAAVDPGAGGIAIAGTGGSPRDFSVSEVDADGFTRNLALIAVGDNVTISDDPSTPPITGFARYVVTSTPVDAGAYWTFTATRTDTAGSQTPPPIGTRLRVSVAAGGGGGGGPITVRFDTYAELLDGIVVTP